MSNVIKTTFSDTEFHYMVSASVGGGKTFQAIKLMSTGRHATRNYIYVAPTLALVEQTYDDLKSARGSARNINLVHHQRSENATLSALEAITEATPYTGVTVIITTTTFLKIISMIPEKRHWDVILDEAFNPLDFKEFSSKDSMALCMDLFQEVDGEVKPAPGKTELVARVARRDLQDDLGEYDIPAIRKMCEAVDNPAFRCEWTTATDQYAMMAQYVTPHQFRGFSDVVFMSALFTHSILYQLWTRRYDIEFAEHPEFGGVIDTHALQGPHVRIGHLLAPGDHASRYNLMRNAETGEAYESTHGLRVIDKLMSTAFGFFKGQDALLQINKWCKLERDLPAGITQVRVQPHGLNGYKEHLNAIALAVTNPRPEQIKWLRSATGLPETDLYRAYRIHTVYQFFGRTAVRDRNDTRTKTLLCAGSEDAEFLHALFVGSEWLGQIGGLRSYDAETQAKLDAHHLARKAASLQDDPEYKRLRNRRTALQLKVRKETIEEHELVELSTVKAAMAQLKAQARKVG